MAKENVDLHIHTHTVYTQKVLQGTIPSYAIRYEEAFFLGNQEKEARAGRFARLIIKEPVNSLGCWIRWEQPVVAVCGIASVAAVVSVLRLSHTM